MFDPQKLHPISYISGFLKSLKENIFPLLIGAFIVITRGFNNFGELIFPIAILLLSVISSIFKAIKIFKTRYWIENDQLIMTWGLFSKNRKELNIERIQSVDTSQNIIHQMLGGVNLSIKTPSDGMELDTITKEQSDSLSKYIKERRSIIKTKNLATTEETVDNQNSEIDEDSGFNNKQQEIHYRLSQKELLKMSFTSGGIFIVFAALGSFYGIVRQAVDVDEYIGTVLESFMNVTSIILIVAAFFFLISYIIGSLIVYIRNYNYTLTFDGELLFIKYGLFTVQNKTVPIKKIQALKEEQSLIRKMFGYTKVSAIITSDGNFENEDIGNTGNVMILPFMKKKKAYKLLSEIVPQFEFQSVKQGLPLQGIRRRVFIPTVVLTLIATPIQIYLWSYTWIIAIVLVMMMVFHASIVTLKSGYKIYDDSIVILNASPFSYETHWANRNKILTYELLENPIIKKSDIAHFNIQLAHGDAMTTEGLKFINKEDAIAIYNWYREMEVESNASEV